MNRTEILENIRKQFKQLFSATSETMPVTTSDNKNLLIMGDGIEIGYTIVEVNDDNTQTPLADGEYTLVDGTKIGVTGGAISAIMAPEPAKDGETSPVDVATVEMADMPTETETPTEEKPASDLEKRISELEYQLKEVMSMLSDTIGSYGKLKDTQVEMSNQLKKISEQPDGTSINVKKMVQTGDSRKISTLEEIREIQKKLNKG